MSLSDNGLAYIRSRIGAATPPTDAQLYEAYDRTGLAAVVALEITETRLNAVLTDGPSSFNASGIYSEDYTSVITGLRDKIKRLQADVEKESQLVAAGIDPFAPVDSSEAASATNLKLPELVSNQLIRRDSSWGR